MAAVYIYRGNNVAQPLGYTKDSASEMDVAEFVESFFSFVRLLQPCVGWNSLSEDCNYCRAELKIARPSRTIERDRLESEIKD